MLYCSSALAQGKHITQLKARHRAGQTFLTWQEIDPPVRQETITVQELKRMQANLRKQKSLLYRVYRSLRPITSVKGMAPVAEVPPLTAWNTDYYGLYPQPTHQAMRYVVEEGQAPVPPGTGIYVYNPVAGGHAYYAVTVVIQGQEETTLTAANTLSTALPETSGLGIPVLQRVLTPDSFLYVDHPVLHYYVRWEVPPNVNVPGQPFDYLVAIPSKVAKPAPVGLHLHGWGSSLNEGYGWWYNAGQGAILIASNQIPYDWWTGYHERLNTAQPLQDQTDWLKGVVRAYSQHRMLAFLDWVGTKWEVDLSRTFVAGNSMGGSGALMLAIRFPERLAWAVSWVGVHIPSKSPRFQSAYAGVYGKPEWGVQFEDGTPVWDYFNDAWYLRQYPAREVGFLTFSNGKNDQAIGWPQAVEFYQALQETKRPHLFVWSQDGHGARAAMPHDGGQQTMPIDIRIDQTLPAFTRGSLDDKPGNGHPADGDPAGQINRYLYWDTKTIIDEPYRWEMTIGLTSTAPAENETVDMTPRRCQRFKVIAGEQVTWRNTTLHGAKVLQSGHAVVDQSGLVTLEKLVVSKNSNRITMTRTMTR